MSAISNMIITDSEAVVHTFVPVSTQGGVSLFRENITDLALIGQPHVRITMKEDQTGNGVNKVTCALFVPVLEASVGANALGYTAGPKVAHKLQSLHTFFVSPRSTELQRRNLRYLARELLNDAMVFNAVDKLQGPY